MGIEKSESQPLKVAYIGKSEMALLRAEAFLAEEGIAGVVRKFGPAFFLFDDAVKGPAGAWGELLVSAADADRATELLESLEPLPPEELPEAPDE